MSLSGKLTAAEKRIALEEAITRRALVTQYKRALEGIRRELGKVYAKYEAGGVLTYAEMAKYNRLSDLFSNIGSELKQLGAETKELTEKLSANVYQQSYYRTAYAIEAETGLNLGFGLLNPNVIKAAVQMKLDKLTLNNRLARQRLEINARIRSEITQGLIRGRSYGDMARNIQGVLEGDASKAIRIARTEAHRVQIQGRLDSIDVAGAEGVKMVNVWDATLDNRTREDHREMDGQKVPLGEDFTLPDGTKTPAPSMSGVPEQDINCRCRIRAEIVGYEPKVRRIRGEGVQPYQTYNEWAAGRGVGVR